MRVRGLLICVEVIFYRRVSPRFYKILCYWCLFKVIILLVMALLYFYQFHAHHGVIGACDLVGIVYAAITYVA